MKDANGNVDTSFGENIEASLTSGSGSLGGTVAVSPSSGVATFTDLAYTAASDGEGFQVTFDDATGGADLTLVTTARGLSADVIATQLVFTQQPSGAVNGVAMSTQPIVTARDASSLTDTDFTDTITLSESGTGSLVNPSLSATSGVATFSTVQYTAVTDQETVTLTADDASGESGGDLGSVAASSLTASAGAASQVDLSFDGSAIQADGSSTKSVSVLVLDATGLQRSTDSATSVTLAVSGTGTGGGTQTVTGGSATFTVTSTTSVGTVSLTATSGGLTGDTGSFNTANNAPVADTQTVGATEDVDVTITLTGSDSDNDSITFLISTLPANGTLYQTADGTTRGSSISSEGSTVTDGSGRVIYISAQDGNGTSHGNFVFKANDASVNSSEATVTVNVTGTEDAPKAVDDALSVNEDMPADLSVLANDSDPDGDALTLESASAASLGSVSVNGNGTVRYSPQGQINGSDTFEYTINDGKGNVSSATASVTIVPVNDGPFPADDHSETLQNTPGRISVLENDTDIESGQLRVVGTGFAQNGSVSLTAGEWIEYNPEPGFFGEDSFTYVL